MGQLATSEVKRESRLFSMAPLHRMAKQRVWKSNALPDCMGVSNVHLERWDNTIQAGCFILRRCRFDGSWDITSAK